MANCPNRNAPEYKALMAKYETNIATDNVINSWQKLNGTEEFPSVSEADEFLKNQKVFFAAKQKEFGEAVLGNLRRAGLISSYQGTYYVQNSDKDGVIYDETVLQSNYNKILRYLNFNNISLDTVSFKRTKKSFVVTINDGLFTATDMLEKTHSNTGPHTNKILQHMKMLFPQIAVKVLTVNEAKTYYDALPEEVKTKLPFSEVNSFYVNGVAVLIKGRVTDETAIEEVLHPFVDSLYSENPKLFEGLLQEAKKNFPVLAQTINDAYTTKRGFNDLHRNLELVTQTLVRHFKKEYESQPTQSFMSKIKQFLDWFANVVKDIHKYITGGALELKTSDIKSTATFTDIAKLLNTSQLSFKFNKLADRKVRYALSDRKQKIIEHALSQSNDIQTNIINRLFNTSMQSSENIDSLSAGMNDISKGNNLVILNKENHTYVDISTGQVYNSTTSIIKGSLKDMEDNQLNIAIGNDFDAVLDGIVSGKTLAEITPELTNISGELALRLYRDLQGHLKTLKSYDAVAIPQVVLFDKSTGTAGTADILIINPDGSIKILDLKTSKNYLASAPELYERDWDLEPDSALVKLGVTNKLSTKQQHNLQVNIYKRMLENMGYKVDDTETAASTFHIKVDITGKGANQVFNGDYEIDGVVYHSAGQNQNMVDALVPLNIDTISEEAIDKMISDSENSSVFDDDFLSFDESLPEDITDANGQTEYNSIFNALVNYKKALLTKKEALEKIRSGIYMDRSREQTVEDILNSVAMIEVSLGEGPKVFSATYTALVRDALKQVNNFTDYMLEPANMSTTDYIHYALNFERFVESFQSLMSIGEVADLNATQARLNVELKSKLEKLQGTKTEDGIIDVAIFNYVKETIRTRSNQDFTEDDLNMLLTEAKDISYTDLYTRDAATSTDTILAIMDKIYKSKKQELLDKVEVRESMIRMAGSKLARLANETDPQKLYDFMLELEADGSFTGNYVKKLGPQYFNKMNELRGNLFDEEGNWKSYINIDDLSTADPKHIAFNKELYAAKQLYKSFWQAETQDENGNLIDGEYHAYNEDFKKIRSQYEMYVAGEGGSGYWVWKRGISDTAKTKYTSTYFDIVDTEYAVKKNGVFTGKTTAGTIRVPKRKYRVAKEITSKGVDMRSEKYKSIMNPTDALGQAQKEFYEMFVDQFENQLLTKLPAHTRDQMLGKVPLIKSNFINSLKKESNLFNSLYAKTVRSVKNYTTETTEMRRVVTDETGKIVDSLPIFYIGNPANESEIKRIEDELLTLDEDRKNKKITIEEHKAQKALLNGKLQKIYNVPTRNEISKDMTTSLLKFAGMAENYETMGTIEDTLNAMVKVIEKRSYSKASGDQTVKWVKGALQNVGYKNDSAEYNLVRRAKKFMKMVYYDNDKMTKSMFDKITGDLVNYSSLSYVAFNPFGNLNNYVMGRLNNSIEALGGRFFAKKSYLRAEAEFNRRALPDLVSRMGQMGLDRKKGKYDQYKPHSKYEAFVDLLRMMDNQSDIREAGRKLDEKSYYDRFVELGYVMQDAAEYNVQTKIGMALVIDATVKNSTTGETLSLYDAMEFDPDTHELKLKTGFDKVIKKNKQEVDFNDDFKYELRNNIREVNKQIHGNYAYEDRMVIQSFALGQLASQFKKWVAPALRARFQKEYFDENLGWMEGRYKSTWNFLKYAATNIKEIKTWEQSYKEDMGFKADGSNNDQRIQNKVQGMYRTLGEIAILLSVLALRQLFDGILGDEDDDDEYTRKFKHIVRQQTDRTAKEMVALMPLVGIDQQYQMISSPVASAKVLGELGQALTKTVSTAYNYSQYQITGNRNDWQLNPDVFYQRKPHKGKLKLAKEWQDAIPILTTFKKWDNYTDYKDFFFGAPTK